MINKTLFKRFLIGVKIGFVTPTLPYKIIQLQSNIFIRILGGMSFLLVLSKNYINYSIYLINLTTYLDLVLF